jgi:hypothetical protein
VAAVIVVLIIAVAVLIALRMWLVERNKVAAAEADARKWEAMNRVVDPPRLPLDPPAAISAHELFGPKIVDDRWVQMEVKERAERALRKAAAPRPVPKPDPAPERPTDVWE